MIPIFSAYISQYFQQRQQQQSTIKVKAKVKFTLHKAMKAQTESKGTALLCL